MLFSSEPTLRTLTLAQPVTNLHNIDIPVQNHDCKLLQYLEFAGNIYCPEFLDVNYYFQKLYFPTSGNTRFIYFIYKTNLAEQCVTCIWKLYRKLHKIFFSVLFCGVTVWYKSLNIIVTSDNVN